MKKVLLIVLTAVLLFCLASCDGMVGEKLFRVRVLFDSNGGSNVASQFVSSRDKVSAPEDPEREDYLFAGWTTDKNADPTSENFDFDTPITKSTTLYAKWVSSHYIAFTATEGTVTIGMKKDSLAPEVSIQYSTDAENWEPFTVGTTTVEISVSGDYQTVYFQAKNANKQYGDWILQGYDYYPCANYFTTYSTDFGKVNVSGNIMSLLDNTGEIKDLSQENDYVFLNLFSNCTNIENASSLILPAKSLAEGCYINMFFGCSNLKAAPALPATELAQNCYASMFNQCTSLQTSPALPAIKLADSCYSGMFFLCTSLTKAPKLPATKLCSNCYLDLFSFCISLQTAPLLPATELAQNCYAYMFNTCTSLQTAPVLPATELAETCYREMFNNCTSLQTAPDLPATTLVDQCYYQMFNGCTSLQSITVQFTAWDDLNSSTEEWLKDVSATGTFTCPSGLNTDTRDSSHVPSGWTVSNN